ncbi:MAG: hypothetical protein QW633_01795 [Candidatus Aenigmatarchaeota archaeon]
MLKGFLLSIFILSFFFIFSIAIVEKALSDEFLSKTLFNLVYSEFEKNLKEQNISKEEFKNIVCSYLNKIEINTSFANVTIKCEEFKNFEEFISLLVNKSISQVKSIKPKCEGLMECIKKKEFTFLFQIQWNKLKIYATIISLVSLISFIVLSRDVKEITRKIGIALLVNSLTILIPIYLLEMDIIDFKLPIDISEILMYTKSIFMPILIFGLALITISFIFKKRK